MNRLDKLKVTAVLLVVTAANIFAFGNKQTQAPQLPVAEPGSVPARAEQVVKALFEAYPQQISKVEFRDGDWAVLMRDKWYYYAEGRLLQEEQRENWENYRSVQFYRYPAELPPLVERGPEETARLSNFRTRNSQITTRRASFFEDLWEAGTREESNAKTKTIRFLGRSTKVHSYIVDVLALVETRIQAAAKTDPQVQTWLNTVTTEGWSWRNVAESQSRSFHSYGVAVDLLPRSLAGKQTYWLWSADWREDWWNIPYNQRYHPPDTVIKIFENYGFVWGGKWFMFDTMHFEYRPEVMILNGLPLEVPR